MNRLKAEWDKLPPEIKEEYAKQAIKSFGRINAVCDDFIREVIPVIRRVSELMDFHLDLLDKLEQAELQRMDEIKILWQTHNAGSLGKRLGFSTEADRISQMLEDDKVVYLDDYRRR